MVPDESSNADADAFRNSNGGSSREHKPTTDAPSVSVITITFKDLDGLKRTVESVRAQHYPGRIEHLVIDGGSGDDVVSYLSGSEPAFAFWQSAPDGGRYDAMNQGIAHATGDLLWFMHSSDVFPDSAALADAVAAIPRNKSVRDVWGYGRDNLVGLGRVRSPMPFSLRKFLAGWQVIPHQASFFGSSLVSKMGGYDLDFGIAADQEFILRAALLCEPITIPRVLCDFDTNGVGTNRPPDVVFDDLGRMWDMHGRYPWGGRLLSRAYLNGAKDYFRALAFIFGRLQGGAATKQDD